MSARLWVAGAVILGGVVVPWTFMRMLAPSLVARSDSRNYRGARVHMGLGVVWLVWAGCAMVVGAIAGSLLNRSILPILTVAGPLALVAFGLGIVDDTLGSGADRGFRGHFSALARGRMTTGMLKLVGMGAACVTVALVVQGIAPWGGGYQWDMIRDTGSLVRFAAAPMLAAVSIALTSNFVNLTDLRPGRALKVYSLLAVLGVLSTGWVLSLVDPAGRIDAAAGARLFDSIALALFVLGPVVAVWGDDLGEIGMLGDAGANPMGAIAGLLIVAGLPVWGLVVYAPVMLLLNLMSEWVSFSSVIEGDAVLSRLDALGRRMADTDSEDSSKSSPESDAPPE